jgi:ABC-type multidrug transport system ATPase subunit
MGIIVALKGRKECGKTSTLKLILNILKEKYQIPDSDINVLNDGEDITIIISNINGHK